MNRGGEGDASMWEEWQRGCRRRGAKVRETMVEFYAASGLRHVKAAAQEYGSCISPGRHGHDSQGPKKPGHDRPKGP